MLNFPVKTQTQRTICVCFLKDAFSGGEVVKGHLTNCQLSVVKISVSVWTDCDFIFSPDFLLATDQRSRKNGSLR